MKNVIGYEEAKKAFENGLTVRMYGTLLVYDKTGRTFPRAAYSVSRSFPATRHAYWEVIE